MIYDGLTIITPTSDIEKMMMRETINILNARFPLALSNIESEIAAKIKQVFVNTPEYDSLTTGGDLAKAFGLPQSDAIKKLDSIINTLADSLEVKFKRFTMSGPSVNGGITVSAFLASFKDILRLSDALVVTDKGQALPWLEWLLIEGDKIIITDYEIAFGPYATSRAGGAIMVQTNGAVWRVPPQYSGIINNNWITRAIDTSSKFLESVCTAVMEKEIDKVL